MGPDRTDPQSNRNPSLAPSGAEVSATSRSEDIRTKVDIKVRLGSDTVRVQVYNDGAKAETYAYEKKTTRMYVPSSCTGRTVTLTTPRFPNGKNDVNGIVLTHIEDADRLISLSKECIDMLSDSQTRSHEVVF